MRTESCKGSDETEAMKPASA